MFHNDKFTRIHVNPEEVIKDRQEPQKTNLIEFRKDEKERMTKLQFQQEHMGLFVGGIQRFFPDELIDIICTLPEGARLSGKDNFQGVDVARMGGDETVLVSLNRQHGVLSQIDMEIPEAQSLTDTVRLILHKDKLLKHKRIYIDTTGMGWGVFDPLKEDPQTKRKVVAIENVKKSLDREKGKPTDIRKKTMKEDLYNNLKNLMENDKIKLFDDPRTRQSLRSIQYDNQDGFLKIYGNYSHIVEALIRAAWAIKDKSLNLYVY